MKIKSPQFNLMYRACMKASRTLIRDFGEIEKLQVSEKSPGDFVTASDKRVEKIIISELEQSGYSFLSEEAGSIKGKEKDKRWIIDPIDGTFNFLNGLPHFAISIAYEEKSEIVSGIIFDPIKNEMYFAEKGNGAYLNNFRIRVSNKSDLKSACLVTGGPKFSSKARESILEEYKNISMSVRAHIRKSGSAALDIAYVASGRYDGFWQREINYWDIAAGIILIKESGGFVENIKAEEFSAEKVDIVASNSKIHKELRNLL
tara:strand:+ start:12159 stop:12938 length:780 start_codon:yes stop_codon:yes gene_type:complete